MEEQNISAWQNMLDRLSNWIDLAILNLPNVLIAIIIFIITYWLSRNLQNWSDKALKKIIKQASVRGLISNIASIIVIALGLFLALGVLNLDQVLKSLLAGAGVAGLAVGLALQGTLSNTFSGIFLAVNDILNVGDWIETNGFAGRVIEIDLRNTKIKEADNNIVIVPNKLVLDNPFKNYGLTQRLRTSISCGVSYDSDLKMVRRIAVETIKKMYPPINNEKIEFHYLNFGGSSIDFQLRFWVNATANLTATEAKSEAIIAIKEAFDKHEIDIPYPIRTIYTQE
ncbi:MAG: mechanosensitive ion channel family protein [Chitinophagales bacterium]